MFLIVKITIFVDAEFNSYQQQLLVLIRLANKSIWMGCQRKKNVVFLKMLIIYFIKFQRIFSHFKCIWRNKWKNVEINNDHNYHRRNLFVTFFGSSIEGSLSLSLQSFCFSSKNKHFIFSFILKSGLKNKVFELGFYIE